MIAFSWLNTASPSSSLQDEKIKQSKLPNYKRFEILKISPNLCTRTQFSLSSIVKLLEKGCRLHNTQRKFQTGKWDNKGKPTAKTVTYLIADCTYISGMKYWGNMKLLAWYTRIITFCYYWVLPISSVLGHNKISLFPTPRFENHFHISFLHVSSICFLSHFIFHYTMYSLCYPC